MATIPCATLAHYLQISTSSTGFRSPISRHLKALLDHARLATKSLQPNPVKSGCTEARGFLCKASGTATRRGVRHGNITSLTASSQAEHCGFETRAGC